MFALRSSASWLPIQGNWTLIFFSPSRESCLPHCAPGLRQWHFPRDREVWFDNTMACDAWTTMYVMSPRGMDYFLNLANTDGFGTGIDTQMVDHCPPGECYTLYSGVGAAGGGVLAQSFDNAHDTIDNLGPETGPAPWVIIALPVSGLLLAAVAILAIAKGCFKPLLSSSGAPAEGKQPLADGAKAQ